MSGVERNIISISEGFVELSMLIADGTPTLRIEANTMTGAKFSADFPLDESVVEDIHNAYYEAERIVENERNRSNRRCSKRNCNGARRSTETEEN